MDYFWAKGVRGFEQITSAQCGLRGIVPAEFRFRMCNDNADAVFVGNPQHNLVKLRGKTLGPRGWSLPLGRKKCRSYKYLDSINFCQRSRKLSIAMQGDLITGTGKKKFCRCFFPWESSIEYVDPSPSPTIKRSDCDMSDAVISKIVIPSDNPASKYIQLYFGPSCSGPFNRFFRLVLWENGQRNYSYAAVLVSNIRIPLSGYVNICNNADRPAGVTCHHLNYSVKSVLAQFKIGDKIALIEKGIFKELVHDIFSISDNSVHSGNGMCMKSCEYFS